MIPAPLIMEAAISRRVQGVLRGTVLVLGASGEVSSELSPGEASFLHNFQAGLQENPLLKPASSGCSCLTHFVETRVGLKFSF